MVRVVKAKYNRSMSGEMTAAEAMGKACTFHRLALLRQRLNDCACTFH